MILDTNLILTIQKFCSIKINVKNSNKTPILLILVHTTSCHGDNFKEISTLFQQIKMIVRNTNHFVFVKQVDHIRFNKRFILEIFTQCANRKAICESVKRI